MTSLVIIIADMVESENKLEYRQEIAFVPRDKEWKYLKGFIDKRPSEILFIHGPRSSGKTTLLYKFLEEVGKEQNLDVKFLNLRKILISDYEDFIRQLLRSHGGHLLSAGFQLPLGY